MEEETLMRRRGLVVVLVLISGLLSMIGAVSAQTDGPSEVARLIQAFRDADATGDLVVANDPAVISPFGGPSQQPQDVQDRATVVETLNFNLRNVASISFGVQPGLGFSAFDPGGVDVAISTDGPNGEVHTEILSLPFQQRIFPPVQEGGAPSPGWFFDVVFGWEMSEDNIDDFLDGRVVEINGATIVPSASGGPSNLNGPLVIRGARFASPPPPGFCPLEQFDFFTGDAIAGDQSWMPGDAFPNDSFRDLSQAHVTRCVDNELQPTELLVNNGSQFRNQNTDAFAILFDDGTFFQAIPANEVAGSVGTRTGMFITPSPGGFQADNVGFSTAPDYPELRPVNQPVVLINHPWQSAMLYPFGLTFAEGSNGSPGFEGNYGILLDTTDESGETNEFSAMMIQLDSYQLQFGTFTYDPTDGTYTGELKGSGDGYMEKTVFLPGMIEYAYDSGSPEMYAVLLEPGNDLGLINEMEQVYDERETAAAPPAPAPTVAPATTPPTNPPTAATAAPSGGAEEPVDESGSSFLLILVGLIVLVAIASLFWWFFFAKKPDPCHELYLAWQKAKAACEKATADAKAKRKAADDAAEATKKAEKAKKDHCKAFPPACGPQSSATDVDSGRTVTRDDLHVQRQWSANAWGEYRAGNQTAQETQDQWNTPPPADFRDKAQKDLDAAKAKTPGLDKAVTDAKATEKAANDAADAAEKAVDTACADASGAKKGYDDCMGAASAGAAAGAAVGGAAGAAVAGQAGGQGGGKNCDPQQQAYDTAKKVCDEARTASDKAAQAAKDAEQAVEDAEEALEDLCDEYPPLCRDDWIEDSGDPGSRVTTRDLFLQDVWADQVWLDYENGDISAQEASDRWSQDPPADFARDELRKLEEARPLKPAREQAIKDAKAKAETARSEAEKAKKKAEADCAKADAAKKALDACLRGLGEELSAPRSREHPPGPTHRNR